jgi:hypothetical protein
MFVRQLPRTVADAAHGQGLEPRLYASGAFDGDPELHNQHPALADPPHGYQRKVLGSRSVAVEFLAQLAPLLGFQRQGRGRAGEQA